MSTRLMSGIAFLLALILAEPVTAQTRIPHPFDGMSAMEISLQAALKRLKEEPETTLEAEIPAEGESSVEFYSFDIVELKGHPLHQGEWPIPGEPLPGTVMALAVLHGPWQTAEFSLLAEGGSPIQNITLGLPENNATGTTLFGEFELPNEPFNAYVSGVDMDGATYSAISPRLFKPQTVEVRFDPEKQVVQPGLVELIAEITNYGSLDTFQISVVDDMDVGVSSNLSEVELATDESSNIALTLNMPSISYGILIVTVTVSATATSDNSIYNYGNSEVRVERFNHIFSDGFDSFIEDKN